MPSLRPSALTIVLAVATLAPGAPTAGAVLVEQHPLPKGSGPASAIFDGSQGLLISVPAAGVYETVSDAPSFVVKPGPAGLSAQRFFTGPDGQTWILGGVAGQLQGQTVAFPSIQELGGGGLVTRFTYSQPYGNPLSFTGVATGPDGSVWLADPGTSAFERYVPGAAPVPVVVGSSVAGTANLVEGSDGALWATDVLSGTIERIAPEPGAVPSETLAPGGGFGSFGNAEPDGIVAAPDGALWYAEQNAASIVRMTPAGEVERFAIPSPRSGATPGGVGYPAPRGVAVGPEGAIWFTDPGDDSVGRVLDGQVSEYPVPGGEAVPDQIATAGTQLWFTEDALAALGSVDPAAVAPASVSGSEPAKRTVRTVHRSVCGGRRFHKRESHSNGARLHLKSLAVGNGSRSHSRIRCHRQPHRGRVKSRPAKGR